MMDLPEDCITEVARVKHKAEQVGHGSLTSDERCLHDFSEALNAIFEEGLAAYLFADHPAEIDDVMETAGDSGAVELAKVIGDAVELFIDYVSEIEKGETVSQSAFNAWKPSKHSSLRRRVGKAKPKAIQALIQLANTLACENKGRSSTSGVMPAPRYLVRPLEPNGIPMSAEDIPELDQLFSWLDERPRHLMTQPEADVYDIYRIMGGTEVNGLTWFWATIAYEKKIFDALHRVGAPYLADYIMESQWVAPIVQAGSDETGHYKITPEDHQKLSEIEERLYAGYIGLPTKLLEYAKSHGVGQRQNRKRHREVA